MHRITSGQWVAPCDFATSCSDPIHSVADFPVQSTHSFSSQLFIVQLSDYLVEKRSEEIADERCISLYSTRFMAHKYSGISESLKAFNSCHCFVFSGVTPHFCATSAYGGTIVKETKQ